MKNVIMILLALLVGFGIGYWYVNQKTDTVVERPNTTISQQSVCDNPFLKLILEIIDPDIQLSVLQSAGGLVCNSLFFECVIDLHTIADEAKFEQYATDHAENSSGTIHYYKITAKDLKTAIEDTNQYPDCYTYHVIFDLKNNTGQEIAVPSRLKFDKDKSCYSIPLLKGIIEKLIKAKENLDTVEFEFCNAMINGKAKIIFKVKGAVIAASYYDLTVNPTFGPVEAAF